MELIFATHNQHKVEEISRKIPPSFIIKSLNELNYFQEIIEDGDTLEANALIKARVIYQQFEVPCFSEDTGLEVYALDNAPGVHTARYAGDAKNPDKNMDLLLSNLASLEDRRAQFRAVIALKLDDQEVLFEGVTTGVIGYRKKGNQGFGYDPIFIPDGYDQTFAELGPAVKDALSHRARAFDKMVAWLDAHSDQSIASNI